MDSGSQCVTEDGPTVKGQTGTVDVNSEGSDRVSG